IRRSLCVLAPGRQRRREGRRAEASSARSGGLNPEDPKATATASRPAILTRTLSNALTVANLLAILLIVAIHYNTKSAIASTANWNYIVQEFITNGIARAAVPLFALM